MDHRGAKPDIKKVEDLKGKTLGYARAGAADYDEGATVLERFFNMKVGKDYKVISFQGEPERIAALINGDIAGRAGLGAARRQGVKRRHQGAAADRRLHPARRRHVLGARRPSSTRIPRR